MNFTPSCASRARLLHDIADRAISTATADIGYARGKVYGGLKRRGIEPLIPAKRELIMSRVPLRRFRYDARHEIVRCTPGAVLRPGPPVRYSLDNMNILACLTGAAINLERLAAALFVCRGAILMALLGPQALLRARVAHILFADRRMAATA